MTAPSLPQADGLPTAVGIDTGAVTPALAGAELFLVPATAELVELERPGDLLSRSG